MLARCSYIMSQLTPNTHRTGHDIEKNVSLRIRGCSIPCPTRHRPSSSKLYRFPLSSSPRRKVKYNVRPSFTIFNSSHTDIERSRIITVQCRPQGAASQGICPFPLLQDYFPESVPNTIILTQGLNGEPLRFPLHIWYCPTSLQRGSPVNRAIFRITSGAAAKQWCGPVVVLKFNGSRRQGYSDAGSNDLPALSAYFLAYK